MLNLSELLAEANSQRESGESYEFAGRHFSRSEGGMLYENINDVLIIDGVKSRTTTPSKFNEAYAKTLCRIESRTSGEVLQGWVKHPAGKIPQKGDDCSAVCWAKPSENRWGISFNAEEWD